MMPFSPNETPPKYTGEYPPPWASEDFYEDFCKNNNFIFNKDDMWKMNTPWYVFYKLIQYEIKKGYPRKANILNLKHVSKETNKIYKKCLETHKVGEG